MKTLSRKPVIWTEAQILTFEHEARAQALADAQERARAVMGRKWVCHPDHPKLYPQVYGLAVREFWFEPPTLKGVDNE